MKSQTDSVDLERFRNYLLFLARLCLVGPLRLKVEPDDLVQQAFLSAHHNRETFVGESDDEIRAWLRKILANTLNMAQRALAQQKRNPVRERTIQDYLDASSAGLENWFVAQHSSPSQRAVRHEQIERLSAALLTLPEDYREVLVLRHCQGLSLRVIAESMGRTPDAIAGLLKRGMSQLRDVMQQG